MPFREITDSNLIAKYQKAMQAAPAQAQEGFKEITDPDKIAAYQKAMGEQPQHHYLDEVASHLHNARNYMDKLAGYSTALLSGPIQLAKDVNNFVGEGLGKLNPKLGNMFTATFSPESAAESITGKQIPADKMSQYYKAGGEALAGVGSAPEISGEAIAKLSSPALRMAARGVGQILPQSLVGAAETPQDREVGAMYGFGGKLADYSLQGLSKLAQVADEKIYPKKFIADSYDKIKKHYSKLLKSSQEGYAPIQKFGSNIVLSSESPAEQVTNELLNSGSRINTDQYKRYLKALDQQFPGAEGDELKNTFRNKLKSPDDLDEFESFIKRGGGDVKKAYKKFIEDPTLQNADDFKKELSSRAYDEGKAGHSGNMQTLNSLRADLKKNVIMPHLESIKPGMGHHYDFSDRIYENLKRTFKNKDLNKIGKGAVLNLDKTQLLKALKNSYEDNNLKDAPLLSSIYKDLTQKNANPLVRGISKYVSKMPGEDSLNILQQSGAVPAGIMASNLLNPYKQ